MRINQSYENDKLHNTYNSRKNQVHVNTIYNHLKPN